MKSGVAAVSLILLPFGGPACAHRLDEYLQATLISLEQNRVQAQIRLTPGVAVVPLVLATIDRDGDGAISPGEQRAYAERVLGDLSLAVDGEPLRLNLISMKFPTTDEMKNGLGEIQIDFSADLRRGGSSRRLVFENRHLRPIAAYLVNCLVPLDPDIRVSAQSRNYEQSRYRLEYAQGGVRPWWPDGRGWLWFVIIILFARLAVLWRKKRRGERLRGDGQQCSNRLVRRLNHAPVGR